MTRWQVEGWTITRVADPGFVLELPQDDAARATLQRSPWLHPAFVTDEWALRVGSSTLVVTDGDLVVVVDPWLAFDDSDRHAPRMAALAAAGWGPDDVDVVVNSHIDGIGANVDPATGMPAFPRARYLVPGAEMEALAAGERAGCEGHLEVERAGLLERYDEPVQFAPGLVVDALPGHNVGHYGVLVGDPAGAVVVGHLFLHPAQIANPDSVLGDHDPATLVATRRALLTRCEQEGMVLIGPLFEAPGGVSFGPAREDGWHGA